MMSNNTNKMAFSRLGSIGLPIPTRFMTLPSVEGKYIAYSGNGLAIPSTNIYPQILADISANSPTHGAALGKKALLTYGQGVDYTILPQDLVEFLMDVNKKGESINDILNKLSNDLPTYGGIALKVSWNYNRTINSIEHVPFKNVRLGQPDEQGNINYFVVSNDWQNVLDRSLKLEYKINRFNPDAIQEPVIENNVAIPTQETLDNATQLIYYKMYSAMDNGFYPIPDYASCIDAAFTEESVGVVMRNQISNGINGAYIVSTGDTVLDDPSKQAIIDEISAFTSGAENSGGVMFMPANVKLDKMEALPADTYTEVNSEVRQRIISAHGIPAILVEYSQGGIFTNRAAEMEAAIRQFQLTNIKGYQQRIIRVLNGVLDYVTSKPYDLQIIPFLDEPLATVEVKDTTSLT